MSSIKYLSGNLSLENEGKNSEEHQQISEVDSNGIFREKGQPHKMATHTYF